MFSIGFGEILVIGVVALLVIGPKQLPHVARTVGRLFGELKKATEDLSGGLLSATRDAQEAIHKATDIDEMMKPSASPRGEPEGTKSQGTDAIEGEPSSAHANYVPPDHEHEAHDDGEPFHDELEGETPIAETQDEPAGSSNE